MTPLVLRGAREWRSWLTRHHADSEGVWLRIVKAASHQPGLTIGDALDGALCFGWIDSQRKGHDDDFFLQRYSPRRSSSPWSRRNVERVESLLAEGRMSAAGLAEVAAAKADGRWARAYAPQSDATIPDELETALAHDERARLAFAQLDKSTRYALVLPILKADPSQRARRVAKALTALTRA